MGTLISGRHFTTIKILVEASLVTIKGLGDLTGYHPP